MGPTALNRPLSDEEMEELERQSAGSTGGFDAFNPPASRPLSDAELDAVEMREGAGTALQQTPFGQATDQAAPQPIAPDRPLSDDEMDDLADETVRDPSYIPTFNEWDEWDQKRAARSSSVEGFLRGAGSIAQALGSVAYSVAATPGNFVMRGFGPAYDTLVHSSAEGMRRAGVGIAEMITWAGDTAADIRTSTEREAALDGRLRKQMAEQNAFTGNAQTDAQIFAQAKEKARADGFYELTQDQKSADRREQYDRFVRGRALEQEFLGIGNFTMGNDPIATGNLFGPKFVGGQPSQITAEATTKTDYGIDDSKVDEGIATGVMIAGDPSGWLPLGAGVLNKVKALRRLAVIADKPMGWTAGKLGRVARLAEDIEAKALSAGLTTDRMARASGAVAIGAGAIGISQNNDLAKGIAAAATILPAVKYSGKILRRAEGTALAGQMVAKEMGVGGVGVLRADSASRLADNAAIPGRYRDAMRGFFSGPESSLKRASQNEALPLSARQTMARLDRAGATQAFRIADDAVSGALAGSVVGVPFAAIAPEDKQAEIFGSIATMGALGGAVSGPLTRRAQMADADVARMLADIEAVGGDAVTFAQLPHDKLVRLAAMQGVVSSKVDFVPLRADEYTANEVLNAKNATTTKGLYVDAEDGNRPRIFINIDQLATGDVTGHEIGHAILKSDILGGEIKNNMRNLVNVQYGQDGVVARGREYATKMLADQVEQGVTGIKPEVLTDAEMAQVARGAKPEDIIRSRWQDKDMRERMINERIDEMNQRDMANGGMEWDWARDEIAAETFSGLSGGIDFRNIRQSGPMAAALGAFSGTLDMMGARFRGNGRLETPNRLFEENPLMDTPQMRKAVTDYTKAFDRYLAGMERDSAPKQRGTKIAPTGKASEAARSAHNRVYKNDKVVENDIFIVDANGNQIPKSQQQLDTQERARAATLKSINKRDRLAPVHSNEWGARKVGNRTEVGGPNLPLQFDHFVQIPEWLRLKAREFEAGRKNGQSYRISYNAIGTGVSGSYKIKNLGNVEAITREMVPFGWQLSEKNHLLAKAIDLDAFRAAAIRAVDRSELPDFGNNVKQVEADLKAMLKNYEDGLPGETGIGVLKRNVLNGLLGTGTAVQKAANPLYAELNPKGSIRTFRFDRLNYADAYATGYFPHYHKINTNALPREAGVMSLDEWRQFDADRKATWLNNRAREAGYTNAGNWRGADEVGFRAADAQYRNEFPVPAQGGAAAMPGDATGRTRGQAMPDVVDTPPFFLKSSQAIDAKVQGKVATSDQIKAILTNPQNGIKAEELKWTGVMQEVERLAKENNGKVPKDALLRYLAEDGAVRLEEDTRGAAGAEIRKKLRVAANEMNQQMIMSGIPQKAMALGMSQLDAANLPANLIEGKVPVETLPQELQADALAYIETNRRYTELMRQAKDAPEPRYAQYQLPGGENYREVVLDLPLQTEFVDQRKMAAERGFGPNDPLPQSVRDEIRARYDAAIRERESKEYSSGHFPSVKNYVAHMRLNDRVDAKGKQGLFIEELQSDRHQQGREKGYKGDEVAMRELIRTQDDYEKTLVAKYGEAWRPKASTLEKAYWDELSGKIRDGEAGIPDAPFRTSWPLQLFKRALRDAVADGKDWIGWTTGETQAARYDLSKQVKALLYKKRYNGYYIDIMGRNRNDNWRQIAAGVAPEKLSEVVGKEIADRILAGEGQDIGGGSILRGVDLKVGGEGMKGFYDTMVPKDVAKYVKQWGGQVEKSNISQRVTATQEDIDLVRSVGMRVPKKVPATVETPIWRVNITPQMREGIKKAGQALFAAGTAAVVAEDQLEQ